VTKGAALSTRALLVTHLPTAATRRAAFPRDEPMQASAPLPVLVRPGARGLRGPELRCEQMSAALGLEAAADDALRDWDLGRWRGGTLETVQATDPDGVAEWLADPDATPHGGESLAALVRRAGQWLSGLAVSHTVGVTHPAFVRAAVVSALGVDAAAFWRLDVAPGTVTALSGRDGRWNVTRLGAALGG
jgi:broad specificity phosphatase PhoE